jgi:hypothetical protein
MVEAMTTGVPAGTGAPLALLPIRVTKVGCGTGLGWVWGGWNGTAVGK